MLRFQSSLKTLARALNKDSAQKKTVFEKLKRRSWTFFSFFFLIKIVQVRPDFVTIT